MRAPAAAGRSLRFLDDYIIGIILYTSIHQLMTHVKMGWSEPAIIGQHMKNHRKRSRSDVNDCVNHVSSCHIGDYLIICLLTLRAILSILASFTFSHIEFYVSSYYHMANFSGDYIIISSPHGTITLSHAPSPDAATGSIAPLWLYDDEVLIGKLLRNRPHAVMIRVDVFGSCNVEPASVNW
jgi:hypothetical protein